VENIGTKSASNSVLYKRPVYSIDQYFSHCFTSC